MSRFADFEQAERDALADSLAEYVQDRWGNTGRYLASDDGLANPTVILLAELLCAGARLDGYKRELGDHLVSLLAS